MSWFSSIERRKTAEAKLIISFAKVREWLSLNARRAAWQTLPGRQLDLR